MLNQRQKKLTTYRVSPGDHIDNAISGMLKQSRGSGLRVICTFNDVQIIVSPETTPQEARQQWDDRMNARRSPFRRALYERQRQEYRREAEEAKKRVYQLLRTERMAVPWYKLIGYWRTCWAQKDSLSKETLKFAQGWAVAMQQEIRKGNKVAAVMDRLERELDYVGLSGAAYGIVKGFLKTFWKYGNQLP